MKEFRFIVKVDHSNPIATLQKLGELVCEDQKAFDGVDVDFVQQQNFITAVPVEIALTTELRAKTLYFNPECRFIVTGVPVNRLSNLLEFGYAIFDTLTVKEEIPEGDENPKDEAPVEDPAPVEEEAPKEEKKTYWLNGKQISEEEFNKEVSEFKEKLKGSGFFMPFFEKLFK